MAGLAANLAVFVGTPLVVNGAIFGLGLERSSERRRGCRRDGWWGRSGWCCLRRWAWRGGRCYERRSTHREQRRAEWVSRAGVSLLVVSGVYARV